MILSIFHFIWMQVNEVKTNLSQIGFDVEMIHQMVSGLVSWYIFFNMFFYVTQKCFKLIGVLMLYLLIGSTGREGRPYWGQTGYISGYATTLEIFCIFLFSFRLCSHWFDPFVFNTGCNQLRSIVSMPSSRRHQRSAGY